MATESKKETQSKTESDLLKQPTASLPAGTELLAVPHTDEDGPIELLGLDAVTEDIRRTVNKVVVKTNRHAKYMRSDLPTAAVPTVAEVNEQTHEALKTSDARNAKADAAHEKATHRAEAPKAATTKK